MKYLLYSSRVIRIFLLMVLLSLCSSFAMAQDGKSDLYAVVPDSMRSSFINRLDLFIETMRSERYEKAYDLLAKDYTQKESREDFVRQLKTYYSNGDKFIGFVPEIIISEADQEEEPTEFIVTGCLEKREKGKPIKVGANLDVYAEKGNIYFSKLEPLRGKDSKYMPCSKD